MRNKEGRSNTAFEAQATCRKITTGNENTQMKNSYMLQKYK